MYPIGTPDMMALLHTPHSEESSLVTSLVRHLEASHDLRYHLPWVYGSFIEDIPRRIGGNAALDAAVAALMSAHSNLLLHRSTPPTISPDILVKYSRALMILRLGLDDPVKAIQAETLCAVMLLLICQTFLGTSGGNALGHGEGAAQILKVRAYYNPEDDFESELLLSLRGPVLFEALVNPRIQFSPRQWKILVGNQLDEGTPEGRMMRCLAKAPDLMQRGRASLRGFVGLEVLISETRLEYRILKGILGEMEARYNSVNTVQDHGFSLLSSLPVQIHAHYQRMYGLALAICLIFNCICKAIDPNGFDLNIDSERYSKEVLQLAEEAAIYRPLGASYILLCLLAAWCGSSDKKTRKLVEVAYVDYRSDFPGDFMMDGKESTIPMLKNCSRRLNLLDD